MNMNVDDRRTSDTVDFISQLPPELLGEIFVHTSFVDPNAPLVVGEISKKFFHVIRMTPEAWTNLQISVSGSAKLAEMEINDARCIRKAELWFALSGVCPVHIRIDLTNDRIDHFHRHEYQFYKDQKNHSSIQLTSTEHASELPDMVLPHLLHNFVNRIKGLELFSTTVEEAHTFFNALYPSPPVPIEKSNIQPLPLDFLVLHAFSDGSRTLPRQQQYNRYHSRSKTKNTNNTLINLPDLPCLSHLKLHNHLLPQLSIVNIANLRSLTVAYPLRFDPIPAQILLETLCSARKLEKLEIEGRVSESLVSSSDSTLNVLPVLAHANVNSQSASTGIPSTPPSSTSSSLITLPSLTHLRLRVNNFPAILNHLISPSLKCLEIDDLDGKRPGAAKQSAEVLRGMLIRMELPCENRKGNGLIVLDMCGIAVGDTNNDHGTTSTSTSTDTTNAVWKWCFKRMRTLKELRIKRMDIPVLLGHITPQIDQQQVDDVPVPALSKLVIGKLETIHNWTEMRHINQGHRREDSSRYPQGVGGSVEEQMYSAGVMVNPRTTSPHFSSTITPQSIHLPFFSLTSSVVGPGLSPMHVQGSPTTVLEGIPPGTTRSASLSKASLSSLNSLSSASSPHFSSSPFNPCVVGHSSSELSGSILKFNIRRPDVEVVYAASPDAVDDIGSLSPDTVDFLDLYSV